jgi:hypothetical protein
VLWQGKFGTVDAHRKGAGLLWELKGVDVCITNKRLTYTCEKFKKGSTWFGLGAGELVAGAFMIASHVRAASQRRGKVATGHARYEWPVGIVRKVSDFSWGSGSITLLMRDDTSTITLELHSTSKPQILEVTDSLVKHIASYRANRIIPGMLPERDPVKARQEAIAKLATADKHWTNNKAAYDTYNLTGALKVPRLE